jgi:uncharacterized protein (TIGR03435 family)
VDAKLPEGATRDQVPEMLQTLLGDRFALKQHRAQKEVAIYALTPGKPPLKLKDSPPNPGVTAQREAPVNVTVAAGAGGVSVDLGHGASYTSAGGRFEGKRMTAGSIAAALERFADRPVVDMTGLGGTYDFAFEVTPEEAQVLGLRAAVNAGITLPPQVLTILDTGGDPLPGAVEQLGLKFDARKASVDAVIVDNVRWVPVEN